ncbi:MAG: hypothetical protein AB1568_06060 [Thermodesulfobacteriota bacterium]
MATQAAMKHTVEVFSRERRSEKKRLEQARESIFGLIMVVTTIMAVYGVMSFLISLASAS